MDILIADDEKLSRERIRELLDALNKSFKIREASTGKQTLSLLCSKKIDLLFLDIQMTDMTGFDVLMKLPNNKRPQVIFVTAYDEFAIRAFDVKAVDFLLKPYRDERFYEALDRVKEESQKKIDSLLEFIEENRNGLLESRKALENIVIKKGSDYYFVPVTEIKYIVASAYYAEIFTSDDKKHIYRISMTEFIELLDDNFVRLNRSTIIRLDFVEKVISEGMGDYSIIMKDGNTFPLSKNYRNDFLVRIGIRKSDGKA